MTQLLLDLLENRVILAADRYQLIGGATIPVADNHATKLISNTNLLVAIHGEWPIAAPTDRPNIWLAAWLCQNANLEHASDAAPKLKDDLEALTPPARVNGGGILIASCTQRRPEAWEITGASESQTNTKLKLEKAPLTSPSGQPIAKGIFGSWNALATQVTLPVLPARTDPDARMAFLANVITACERAGISQIRGPAIVESRPAAS